jgi:xylulokinase
VGSSAVRAAVVDAGGRLLGRSRRAHRIALPAPGRAEYDPRTWLAGALATGGEAVAEAGGADVVAVAIGALGPSPLLVDGRLEPLTPALPYVLDLRAEEQRSRLGVTGDHALPKLMWWEENEPEIYRRAAWALDATGYLVAALTGEPTMDAITRAAYEHDAVQADVALPAPLDPLACAGRLRPDAAQALGLRAGTPVAAGTFDTYVDVAGAGVGPGDGCLVLGSTLAVYAVVTEAKPAAGLELTPYPGEGLLLGGTTAAAGSVLRWLSNVLGSGGGDLAAVAAGLEPGSGGLLALPYLAGERAPFSDAGARGALVGLTLATGAAEVYRAFVDALALSAAAIAKRLARRGTWRACGGGCRDQAWLGATSDALGAPVEVGAHAGEAFGAAVLALRSAGFDPPVEVTVRVEPDLEHTALYRVLSDRYRGVYERLRPLVQELPR